MKLFKLLPILLATCTLCAAPKSYSEQEKQTVKDLVSLHLKKIRYHEQQIAFHENEINYYTGPLDYYIQILEYMENGWEIK